MRPTVLLYFAVAALLAGCAMEGVVVEKHSRPFPFVDSVGMDGIYKFKLRDPQGHICSQMVTPEVFFQYEVGDYFNDLLPARRSRVELEDVRTVKTVPRVSHHGRKRSQVAHVHRGKKIAHAHDGEKIRQPQHHGKKVAHTHHGKKIRRAHHAVKRTSKSQARRSRPAAKARLRST